MSCKPRIQSKVISCLQIATGGCLTFGAINYFSGDENFYRKIVMPTIHATVNAELSHFMAVKLARVGLLPWYKDDENDLPLLKTTVWGLQFKNPIGLAAGFDKNGEAIWGMSKLGFGFIEVGTVTPSAQKGNDRPRVFRLREDDAIINRYGFNSKGATHACRRIRNNYYDASDRTVVVGVNLGKNKEAKSAEDQYIHGLFKFYKNEVVDYYTINISSPNTPGLRDLQKADELKALIGQLLSVKAHHKLKKPLLIKIAPDLSYEEKKAIANIILTEQRSGVKVDGIIVSNTTVQRPESLKSNQKLVTQTGGLSGKPLKDLSTQAIRDMYKLTGGRVPIIGVGGVFTGEDAFEKIKAGASLVQLYTALAYEGPPVVPRIKHELADLLRKNGYSNVTEAVGKDNPL